MPLRPLAVPLLLVLFAAPLGAQEGEARQQRRADRLLRILPLGEAPPFKFDFVNGKRVEREPPAGSIPPRQVQVVGAEGRAEGEAIRLSLDRLSGSVPVRPGRVPIHEAGKGGLDPNPWHVLTMPDTTTHGLALLWRDPDEQKWSKARSVTLSDDVTTFPAGMVRVVNVSPWELAVKFDGEEIKLPAGRMRMEGKARAVYRQSPMVIEIKDGQGASQLVFNQGLNQAAGERTTIVVYRADGNKPRRPARVKVLRERAVLPKPPTPASDS